MTYSRFRSNRIISIKFWAPAHVEYRAELQPFFVAREHQYSIKSTYGHLIATIYKVHFTLASLYIADKFAANYFLKLVVVFLIQIAWYYVELYGCTKASLTGEARRVEMPYTNNKRDFYFLCYL